MFRKKNTEAGGDGPAPAERVLSLRTNEGDAGGDESEPLETYNVTYKGGVAALPKPKIGKIRFEVYPDRFEFQAGDITSKKFWEPIVLPYDSVSDLQIVDRTVSTFEGLAGGLDSRQLNQKNVILIAYGDGQQLRFEMLSGFSVMGQAKKCVELEDRLRVHGIRSLFGNTPGSAAPLSESSDFAASLRELGELRDQGLLTPEEFDAQKAKLLG